MKIHYLNYGHPAVASTRYRILQPAMALMRRLHQVSIGPMENLDADVVVTAKHFNAEKLRKQAWRVKQYSRARLVFDVCDDHFDREMGDHYRKMIELADLVSCNTAAMAVRIKAVTGKEATVIADPYELPLDSEMAPPNDLPRILWFGHPLGLNALERIEDRLPECDLVVVSGAPANTVSGPAPIRQTIYLPWSPETLASELHRCDLVIIPLRKDRPLRTKSANRVIESLRAGRFVVAEKGIEDYEQFEPYIWLGPLEEGVQWALENRPDARQKVLSGQKYIEERFSIHQISSLWEQFFRSATV